MKKVFSVLLALVMILTIKLPVNAIGSLNLANENEIPLNTQIPVTFKIKQNGPVPYSNWGIVTGS